MYEVEFTDEFEAWWNTLEPDEQHAFDERVKLLEQNGPGQGRPLVGEIVGSDFDPQMKELIYSNLRVLFIFDPRRVAILLLGGNKEHKWKSWYGEAIPEADRLYREHLEALEREE